MQSIPDVVKYEKLWNDEFHSFSKHNRLTGVVMSEYIVVHGIRIAKDFVPETFGRLTTVGPRFLLRTHTNKQREARQVCLCHCGEIIVARRRTLQDGHTSSCGCLQKDRSTKHGMTNTKEHKTWLSMVERCCWEGHHARNDYGGRGITVCDRWLCPENGFANFYADMGPRPSPEHSIDRIDVNGNYCPENCRWATKKEQSRNKRNNTLLTCNGQTRCVAAWAEEKGMPTNTLLNRLNRGWSAEKAITTPVNVKHRRKK